MDMVIDKKCEMCGAQLEVSADRMKAVCPYCGSTYSYVKPITEDTATYINRANNYRMRNMFDNAIVEYKTLLMNKELKDNAELYWGLLLSEFGIEFVYDSRDDRYVPTCHRTLSGSIFDDANYKKAIELATDEMKAEYAEKAAEIDALQRSIKAQAEQVEDYDVFICFKSTDKKAATEDRYIARRIFDETTKRGFRTFFSEISLKGRLGSEYEPIIYKALTTAKVMILVATKEEYLNAPFVKNEWGRFLERKKSDPLLKIVPVFRDTDVSVLPTREQGIDLSKYPAGGYEIDIADNLERILRGMNIVPNYSGVYNETVLESLYVKAKLDVDTSPEQKKTTGEQYAEKAAAMRDLGKYKDAEKLAKHYSALSESYINKENAVFSRMRMINIFGALVSVAVIALSIAGIYLIDVDLIASFTVFLIVLSFFIAAVIMTISIIYAIFIKRIFFSKPLKTFEITVYSILSAAQIFVALFLKAFLFTINLCLIVIVLVANIVKYVAIQKALRP